MNRYLVLALAGLLAALAGLGWTLRSQLVQNGVQKAVIEAQTQAILRAVEQTKVDQAALARLAQKNAATARKQAAVRASVEAALVAEPAWAAQPVPEEVQRALSQ